MSAAQFRAVRAMVEGSTHVASGGCLTTGELTRLLVTCGLSKERALDVLGYVWDDGARASDKLRFADLVEWLQAETHQEPGAPVGDPTLGDPLRGVSVHHISSVFLEEVNAVGMSRDAKVYDVEPAVIRPKGEQVRCPRDGQMGAAYVDSIHGADHAGMATVMLSYTWGYSVGDIADALVAFCDRAKLTLWRTYVWICCLCINQHMVRGSSAAGKTVPFDVFKAEFGARVRGIRHVAALMVPWNDPVYLSRVWCDFELYTAVAEGVDVTIIMPPDQEAAFRDGLSDHTGVDQVWKNLSKVDVRHAKASFTQDRVSILALIEQGPGFQKFNRSVVDYLQTWMLDSSEAYLRRALQDEAGVQVDGTLLKLCQNVNKLLRQMGKLDRAADLIEQALRASERLGHAETADRANLLRQLGILRRKEKNPDAADAAFSEAQRILEQIGVLGTSDGALLLLNRGIIGIGRGDLQHASSMLSLAKSLADEAGVTDTNVGALIFRYSGKLERLLGNYSLSAQELARAEQIFKETDGLDTPYAVQLYIEFGELKRVQRDFEGALSSYQQGRDIQEKLGVAGVAEGEELVSLIEAVRLQLATTGGD